MSQETRVLLAFAISFGFLLVWGSLIVKKKPQPKQPPKTAETRAPQPGAPNHETAAKGAAQAPAKPAPEPARVKLPVEQGREAQQIVVENDLYRITFSTQGAVIRSWVLKKFRDENGKPLDVINGPACEQMGFPLSLRLADSALASKLNSALFVASPAGAILQAPARLEFAYSDGSVQAKKTFTFGKGYNIQTEVSVFDGRSDLPVGLEWAGGFGDQSGSPEMAAMLQNGVYQHPGGDMETESLGGHWYSHIWGSITGASSAKLSGDITAPLLLAGLEDRYFAAIFIPSSPHMGLKLHRKAWTPVHEKEKKPIEELNAAVSGPGGKPFSFRLFVAPKDLQLLRAENPPLDGLVDFGWFSIIAKPLFLGMRYIYDHWVHNYGWAIVILTIIINMAMFPLKLKQIRSAMEMQKIAPIVKGIQDRYKQYKFNDPRKQRMNQEIMKLYKEHGVNPLGGCLPMALQLPFLYGFYRVLELPIELRHAPWILWIKDLSAPDKYHLLGFPLPILPTLMVISMFVMTKMTPMPTADPAQKRMMIIMPVIFGIMFYNLASGLVLYFLIANLVGIAQQIFINKTVPSPVLVPVASKTTEAKE
jgi:YidC/Oxa1 family membrane protein insertase